MDKLLLLLSEKIGAEVFTEEIQTELKAQVEVQINEKVKEVLYAKEQELTEKVEADLQTFKDEMVERLNEYLEQASEEFFTKNEIAIESEFKVDVAEKVLDAIKGVFAEGYVAIPEGKVDLLDEAKSEVETLKTDLNEAKNALIEQKRQIVEFERAIEIKEATKQLADTQVEKVLGFLEGLEFVDAEDFTRKLGICVGKVTDVTESTETETETNEDLDESVVTFDIDKYLN